MLNRLTNALRGKVRLEVEGAFPERLLNLCAQRGILFWNVEWLEATRLRFTVTRQGAGAAWEAGRQAERPRVRAAARRKRRGVRLFTGGPSPLRRPWRGGTAPGR